MNSWSPHLLSQVNLDNLSKLSLGQQEIHQGKVYDLDVLELISLLLTAQTSPV